MSIVSTNNSNVVLIDPNKENVNPFLPNGLPKYEDMFINVSLTARRRSRSVIYTTGNLLKDYDNTDESVISFIGMNQRDSDINKGRFTTNYYDGSTGEYSTDESFGIQSIKIITDSSYIPRVEIQFIDIRGLSFFTDGKSKYRMFFDFPPPIFELNVKGYYGAPLKYLLHLTSYTTDFSDSNASHIINANFVALTYAPLTDIPFRYIVNFGMMKNNSMNYDPDTKEKPKNSYELSMKLKSLYTSISGTINGSDENKKRETSIARIEKIDRAISYIGILEGKDGIFENGVPSFYIIDNTIDGDDSKKIVRHKELNNYLRLITTNGSIDKDKIINLKIYCGFEQLPDNNGEDDEFNKSDTSSLEDDGINNKIEILEKYKKVIEEYIKDLTLDVNFKDVNTSKKSKFSALHDKFISNGNVTYILLDINDVIRKLLEEKEKQINIRDRYGKEISDKINKLVKTKLGMNPTISEIFGIILDDVDTFFQKMREVSKIAESEELRESRNKILGGDTKDSFNNKIYPFPLVINQEHGKCGFTETRVAPIRQAQSNYIPEIELVLEFIKSFTEQLQRSRLYDIKERMKEDEVNIWIPLSPIDSKIANPEISLNSPYYFFVNKHNVPENSNEIKEMYRTIVKRFIAISQNSQKNIFDWNPKGKKDMNSKEKIVELFARGEAINLISSIENEKSLDILKNIKRMGNSNLFINELLKHDIIETEFINLNVYGGNEIPYYNNRNHEQFKGFKLNYGGVYSDVDVDTLDEENLFNKFKIDMKRKLFWFIKWDSKHSKNFHITQDNIRYFKDEPEKKFNTFNSGSSNFKLKNQIPEEYNGNHLITRFLVGNGNVTHQDRLNTGYAYYFNKNINSNSDLDVGSDINEFGFCIITHWSEALSMRFFREIVSNNDDNFIYSILVLSNFGATLSPFSNNMFKINENMFSNSSIVELPRYVLLYLGLLCHINSNDDLYLKFNKFLDEEYIYFGGYVDGGEQFRKFRNYAYRIIADLKDCEKYLSNSDKMELEDMFKYFLNDEMENIKSNIKLMLSQFIGQNIGVEKQNINIYDLLNPTTIDGETNFKNIIEPIILRVNMLVYSSNTFSLSDKKNDGKYVKLFDYNKTNKTNVDMFFNVFYDTVTNNLPKISKKIEDETADLRKITEDNDIINQTYYSFKNIHDKWISGVETDVAGYPFITDGKLKDYFVYVDRAMNDIGDTMINAELLLDLFNDNDASVFTVLSQILSNNGFEFFPLQNFMTHETGSWENSFKINTNTKVNLNSFFVCMYIGGVSSYPNNPDSEIPNDGIISLSGEELLDFKGGCEGVVDTSETKKSGKFKYSNVFAFIVKYGQQNQSMFKNIKISTREFPETNESIQILSRLAKDESDVQPIPKGQNLYSLYENRAYSASVTTLGNMMIQPTQYFQLENVQLYSGVYIILSVEHNITPNFMETKFDGTKILKYPTPRVTSPVAFTEFASFDNQSVGEITTTIMNNAEPYFDELKYKSFYTNKIVGE